MERDYSLRRNGDSEHCHVYASMLWDLVRVQAQFRSEVEQRWYESTRQYYGKYDANTAARLDADQNKSKLFANQTRPKCITLIARMVDMLFPTGERNWDIQPTKVPELEFLASQVPNEMAPGPERVAVEDARAQRKAAQDACVAMRRLMEDQLEECRYAQQASKAIAQGVMLGTGVLKGPFATWRKMPRWRRAPGPEGWAMHWDEGREPAFHWVDTWNFYPDMDASGVDDMEFAFELRRLNKRQLRDLAKRDDFRADEIDYLLAKPRGLLSGEVTFGNFTRYLKTIEGQGVETNANRYEVFEYHGPVPGQTLEAICRDAGDSQLLDVLDHDGRDTWMGNVWFCENRILKFGLNPLDTEELPYSVFQLDESTAGFFTQGLPEKLRDGQAALNAAWRLLMNNAALSGVPVYIVDDKAVTPNQGDSIDIEPGKTYRRIGPSTENDAIEVVQIAGNTTEIIAIIDKALDLMNDETNLPLVAQGDQGAHAKQTAHGMSLLVAAVNIVFKFAARNWDNQITVPNLRRLYHWNMQFDPDPGLKGDMEVSARGASHLLVKEVMAQNLMMLINLTGTSEILSTIFKIPDMARKLVQALHLPADDIVSTDEEIEAERKAAAENAPPSPEEIKLQAEQIKAETAKYVADKDFETEVVKASGQEDREREKTEAQERMADKKLESEEDRFFAEQALNRDKEERPQ